MSLSRQSDSPSEAAPSATRFIDVVRASLSPDAARSKFTGRHSGQGQSKGRGKGKRSPSREERAPAVELTPRESIRPTQANLTPSSLKGYRLHTVVKGGRPIVTQIDEIHEAGPRGTSSRGPSQPSDRRHSGGKGKRPESREAEGRHSGQGKGKSKGTSGDAGPRPSAMDSAFERPKYGVSSAFVYCLWMIWSGFFKFSEEALTGIYESEIYEKISRELGWILRHSGWTHAEQSLTVFELMAGARFRKLLSVWAHTCHAKEDLAFPAVQKAQIQPWCEASVERINLLLPLAITIMYNQKGRYQVGILSTSDHQKGERFVSNPSQWLHPAGMTAEDRKELAQLYKQFRAAHVFVQAVSGHSGEAPAPTAGLKIENCQLSDMPDTLVHMTEYRHIRSILQYGLLPGGGNAAGSKQRNMNHFLPIDGLLVSHEHIRPTANVVLVLSKATLEKHPELAEGFSLSKNGYFLTKAVIPAGLFSLAWDVRNNCCVSTKLWDVPDTTPAMPVPDEPYLRFYSQFYCEVLRLVGKGHDKFKIETRRLAFKNIKIREIEAWRNEAEEKLDRHQLHGTSKIHAETWLNFLSLDDDWKDQATNMRRLKKRSLSETTEEESGDDLIDVDDDDDMEVDADIPADDEDDDVQVVSTFDAAMVDDLAEARQKGTWVKKGTVKKEESDMPDDSSAAASASTAVKKEEKSGTRVWSSRARSRTPTRTVLKKAGRAPGMTRAPSGLWVSFSDIPETQYSKKRATSRAKEVISDARKAQSTPTKYFHRPEKMTRLVCSSADVLFFCRACSHGTCLDCYHDVSNHCSRNSIYLCSTVPDADIPARSTG